MAKANDPLLLNQGDRIIAFIKILKIKNDKPTSIMVDGVEYVKKPAGQKRRK
jgi:hypothetical protein